MSPSLDELPADRRNLDAITGNDVTRRDFLKGGIVAGAVVGGRLGAFYFGYSSTLASPVRVGILGTGDQGGVLIGALNPNFVQVRAIADVRPYNQHRALHGDLYEGDWEPRPGLMAKYGWKSEDAARKKVKVYDSYEDLIEKARKHRLEAVIIALPLHLHAKAAVAAMKQGLHVFVEPMMARSAHECKEMARIAQQRPWKYLAVGHQRHYNLHYVNAADSIQRGLLGKLHYIRAQYHHSGLRASPAWAPPLPDSDELAKRLARWEEELSSASGREIDVWRKRVAQLEQQIADAILGERNQDGDIPAESFGYADDEMHPAIEELIRWKLWDRTGAGLLAQVGSQQLDAADIFITAAHGGTRYVPLSVVAASNRPLLKSAGDVEDHVFCILEYPGPGYDPKNSIDCRRTIGVQYAAISGNGFGGYGEIVYGTKKTLLLEREQESSLFPAAGAPTSIKTTRSAGPALDTQASAAIGPGTKSKEKLSRGYVEELEHWAWCIRHRARENQPRCGPDVGLANVVVAMTAKLAAGNAEKSGQPKYIEPKQIAFDEDWFDVDSDATPEGIAPDVKRYDE